MNKIKNRILGTNEKVFWVLDQNNSTQFAVAAEIEGNAEDNAWRRAINEVQKRHPNLRVQISGDQYAKAHFESIEHCPIPLRIILDTGKTWNSIVEEELKQPIDITIAPLAKAILIQQSGKCVFIFISNHSIGDGMSVALVIRDILTVLAGKSIDLLETSLSLDEHIGFPLKKTDLSRPVGYKPSYKKLQPRSSVSIEYLKLPYDLTQKLIERSKTECTTVHGALSAAIVIALKKLDSSTQLKPVRILHPLSARATLDIGEEFGLLINMTTLSYNPTPEETFWNFAKDVRTGIAPMQTPDWIRQDIEGTDGLFSSGMDLKDVKQVLHEGTVHEVMLTNLGRLSIESDFNPLKLKLLWGPMVLTPHEEAQTIGVATLNGELTLTLTGQKSSKSLLENLENVLYEACFTAHDTQLGKFYTKAVTK